MVVILVLAALSLSQEPRALAQATKSSGATQSPAKVYDEQVTAMEKQIVDVAEAMPADKYNFVPSTGDYKGVRNFAQQLNHITEANYMMFATLGAGDPGVDPKSIEALTDKEAIIKALKASFAYGHKAMATLTPENVFGEVELFHHPITRAGVATHFVGHTEDIYGQLVEYLRLNGIVPPASRKRM
ncbi:MAG: DinB family protein [Acidobacteriaceae bacterium]